MFWNKTFLTKIREIWLNRLDKFQYFADGIWKDAIITEKSIDGTSLRITTVSKNEETASNITRVRILDKNGDVAGELSENIKKKATQGVFMVWEFALYEDDGSSYIGSTSEPINDIIAMLEEI